MEDSPRISGQCLCWAGHIGLPWGPQEDGTGSRTPGPRRLILREVSSSTSLACDQQACPFPHHQAFPPRRESALCLGRDPHTSLVAECAPGPQRGRSTTWLKGARAFGASACFSGSSLCLGLSQWGGRVCQHHLWALPPACVCVEGRATTFTVRKIYFMQNQPPSYLGSFYWALPTKTWQGRLLLAFSACFNAIPRGSLP